MAGTLEVAEEAAILQIATKDSELVTASNPHEIAKWRTGGNPVAKL